MWRSAIYVSSDGSLELNSLYLDFAGNANIFNETCSGNCYNDYVVGNGSSYATAYFEIGYVRVFSNNFTGTNGTTTSRSGATQLLLTTRMFKLINSFIIVSLALL
jgi:hypothetical protein